MQRVIHWSHKYAAGDTPGTLIRGQVIDWSHKYAAGDNPVTPAAAGECERLFGCLKVLLKVYRLRYFKRIEILRGGDGDVWILYVHNSKTYMYTWKEEDSKKEKKTILNFILNSK